MNILYAVAGEGYGHATRSRPIIEHIRKHHRVRIFAGSKAHAYLRRFFPVSWTASTHLVYRNNSVSQILTVLLNVIRFPLYLLSFIRMLCVMTFQRPDVVITDFEPWSAWAALLTSVRIISIDNENIITNAELEIPRKHRLSFAHAWLITKLIVPFANAVVIPSFFFPPLKNKRAKYCGPVIRPEVKKLRPTRGNHVLVYQTSSTNAVLLTVLKQFPRQKFVVYGFQEKGVENNVTFKQFSEQEFFKDLASAKSVIANGGFSLLSEAVFLRKPVLSIPIKGQCEQLINALHIERLGYGLMAERATPVILHKFLSFRREALKERPKWSDPLRTIDGVLYAA